MGVRIVGSSLLWCHHGCRRTANEEPTPGDHKVYELPVTYTSHGSTCNKVQQQLELSCYKLHYDPMVCFPQPHGTKSRGAYQYILYSYMEPLAGLLSRNLN